MRVLIICTGNQCRSPMAEGLLRQIVRAHSGEPGAAAIEVASAGTGTDDGYPATDDAVTVSRGAGIDIAAHRSRALTARMLDESDLVLTMQAHHALAARALRPAAAERIHLIAAYAGEGPAIEIPDPIGQGLAAYQETFARLRLLLQRAWPRIDAGARQIGAGESESEHQTES